MKHVKLFWFLAALAVSTFGFVALFHNPTSPFALVAAFAVVFWAAVHLPGGEWE